MRRTITRLLCGLAVSAALTGPAAAEEQLVMPFACRVAGGKVALAPSAPRAYQIYGRRQYKRLTTCSPYDPGKCHTWFIHRFDLDCGGATTSWQSVVAALSPILAESLGPPADAGSYDEPGYAPQAPEGTYRPARGIAFPRGFAPNPMNVARFERTGPEIAHIPLPPKKPAAPAQIAKTEPSLETEAPSSAGGKAKAAGKTPVAQKATELAEHQALQIEIDSGSEEVTGSLPKSGAASGTLWRDAGAVFAVMLAALLALSATLLLRRRKLETLPIPVSRLHGPAAPPSLARASNPRLEQAAAEPGDVPATRLRLWDEDWLPATMSEALDVLGVDPHAGRDRMKTTVTRLRRALHPDYALDAEDRALRERRLKQINVAWEIVSGRRRSLFLSVKPRAS